MQDLVQDLLSLARLESAPPSAEGQALNVSELIQSELSTLLGREPFSTYPVDCQLQPQLLLLGRRTEIESVIHNLLSNAFRHTPVGTQIEIVWARQPSGRPALRVSDKGPGIAAEHLPHLTERFYRAEPSRSSALGGTGLGLAIVKHVLQRHGGELQITSEEGRGSAFLALFAVDRASH